jgi:cell division protein FtsN
MDSRCLIFLMILGFPGSISLCLPDSSSVLNQVVIINKYSPSIDFDVTDVNLFFTPEREMQVGAFRQESNALAMKNRLSALLNKTVIIVTENGFFKVRITGFASLKEMEMLLPSLGLLGLKSIWVLPERNQEEIKTQNVVQPDTTLKAIEGKIGVPVVQEVKPVLTEPNINLQIGVFHNRSKALRAQRRIIAKLNLQVVIIQEWEYSKVIVTGFNSREETFKYYPVLAHMGYRDVIIIADYNEKRQDNDDEKK